MTQASLFDYANAARRSDPITSHEAAKHAEAFAGAHHQAILKAMREASRPLSAKEIADALGWPTHHAANRRTTELERGGLIEVAEGDFYINPSGRKARRYKLRA